MVKQEFPRIVQQNRIQREGGQKHQQESNQVDERKEVGVQQSVQQELQQQKEVQEENSRMKRKKKRKLSFSPDSWNKR